MHFSSYFEQVNHAGRNTCYAIKRYNPIIQMLSYTPSRQYTKDMKMRIQFFPLTKEILEHDGWILILPMQVVFLVLLAFTIPLPMVQLQYFTFDQSISGDLHL